MALKAGMLTSEFILSTAATVLGALQMAGMFGDESTLGKAIGAIVVVLGALGYGTMRTKLKAVPRPAPPPAPTSANIFTVAREMADAESEKPADGQEQDKPKKGKR